MMTTDEPETELAPTRSAAEAPTPLAWSSDSSDEGSLLYDDADEFATAVLDGDADGRATFWLSLIVGVAAVAAIVAGVVLWLVVSQHHSEPVAAPPVAAAPAPVVNPSPDDTVVPSTPPAPPPPPPPLSIDEQYLAALRADGIYSRGGDSGSLGIAHAICRALDRGTSQAEVTAEVVQQNPGLKGNAAEVIVGNAIKFYCPPPDGQ